MMMMIIIITIIVIIIIIIVIIIIASITKCVILIGSEQPIFIELKFAIVTPKLWFDLSDYQELVVGQVKSDC